MSYFFDSHQLVHSNDQIADVKSQRNFEPSLVIATVGLFVVDRDREKHHKAAYSTPHYLEALNSFPLHLLLASLHTQILKPGSLHILITHLWLRLLHHHIIILAWCHPLAIHPHLLRLLITRLIHHWLSILVRITVWVVVVHDSCCLITCLFFLNIYN